MGRQPPEGQGLLSVEASRSCSDTPHSLGLLWTSDQHVAETSTWQHTTLTRDGHQCRRRDSNPKSQKESRRRPHASDRAPTWIFPTLQMVTKMHTAC